MHIQLQYGVGFLAMTSSSCLASSDHNQPCQPFPSTMIEFSSSFQQPSPPLVNVEFKASWVQHKWNINVSHITAGFLYNSPAHSKVRADEAYDMNIASSLFDFANISADGLVSNTLYTFTPSIASRPNIFRGFVNPNFPLFTQDFLSSNNAVFTGLVQSPYNGKVASWSILYQNAIPVKILVNECGTVVGYEYFAPDLRTRVVTEYFNIQVGPIAGEIFEFPV